MSEFQVDIQALKRSVGAQKSVSRGISSISSVIRRNSSCLWLDGSAGREMERSLKKLADQTAEDARNIRAAANALSQVARTYQQTETKLTGQSNPFEITRDDIAGTAANLGPLGALAGLMINADGKSKWDIAGSILALVGASAEAYGKIGKAKWWKILLGLTDTKAKGLGESIIEDYSFTGAKTVADKINVVTKWGDAALKTIKNAFENYEEFKGEEGKTGRAIGETIIETATDLLLQKGAVVGLGALLGVTGAPALIGGAVVVWAANGVCKWATGGRDISEVAADFVMDSLENENTGKSVKNCVRAEGRACKTTVNKVKTDWNPSRGRPAYDGGGGFR